MTRGKIYIRPAAGVLGNTRQDAERRPHAAHAATSGCGSSLRYHRLTRRLLSSNLQPLRRPVAQSSATGLERGAGTTNLRITHAGMPS